jgi:hypothetical protein
MTPVDEAKDALDDAIDLPLSWIRGYIAAAGRHFR